MNKIVNQGDVKVEHQNIYLTGEKDSNIYDNLEFKPDFQKYIDSLGINLAHNSKDNIEFDDLYTPPDLRAIEQKKSKRKTKFRNLSEIILDNDSNYNFILLGDDISGKSSAVKFLTKWFYFKGGCIPKML